MTSDGLSYRLKDYLMVTDAEYCLHTSVCPHVFGYVPVKMHVLKGLGVVDGKHTQKALSCPHILISHGTVLLLTCGVQDVQQTRLSVNHNLLSVRILHGTDIKRT